MVGEEDNLGISNISLRWVFATTALLLSSTHAASPQKDNPPVPSCKEAVAQSRMICLTGTNCQREISQILRACAPSYHAACATARGDLRASCRTPSAFDGFRECNAALQQVRHYCAR